ncbi:hypothetical protein BBJ28_00021852, partial [Nothophytophthora sp. Chile5]
VLDVFEQEPLPRESALWEHPSVLLTPHVSGKVFPEDVASMFLGNFNRYLRGEPVRYQRLVHRADPLSLFLRLLDNDTMAKQHSLTQQQAPPLAITGSNGDDSDDGLKGSTLEAYFSTLKTNGQVSQHLLSGSADNDAMAAEKRDNDEEEKQETPPAKQEEEEKEETGYEDDYEAETATPKADEPSSVAGMTLSEYLHVKDTDDAEAPDSAPSSKRPGSLKKLPPQLAATAKKQQAPPSDVSGMSLDHYLGASPIVSDDGKAGESGHDTRADKKASPKIRRRGSKPKQLGAPLPQAKASQSPFGVKGSSLSQALHLNPSLQSLSSDDEGNAATSSAISSPSTTLTPFQRRQKRKDRDKVKQQQQRVGGNGLSVSKAILLAEAAPSPSSTFSLSSRNKRKAAGNTTSSSHHTNHHTTHPSASHLQPPLPKLSPSPSLHNLSHGNPSNDDEDASEKLPPL